MSTVESLSRKGLIRPPDFVVSNTMYEAMVGSVSYGTSNDTSDMDVCGFCIPHKSVIFPHLAGEIEGFGRMKQRFEQYQQHHIKDPSEMGGKGREYDVTIYNIVKFFMLVMENNPNMVDCLFVSAECVLHSTEIGNLVRDNRKMFLHKGAFQKFKGYAYSQLHKVSTKTPQEGSKRAANVEKYGFDTKFAAHVVRLADECEQILEHGDLNLRRASEHVKAVRRGEIPLEEIRRWFADKELHLEKLYSSSKLPHKPDEAKIKALLLQCLEMHYQTLDGCIVQQDASSQTLREIAALIRSKHKGLL